MTQELRVLLVSFFIQALPLEQRKDERKEGFAETNLCFPEVMVVTGQSLPDDYTANNIQRASRTVAT